MNKSNLSKPIDATKIVSSTPWHKLKSFTDARIAIGRAGSSTPTDEMLKFQLAHAQAIDAVHSPLNMQQLTHKLREIDKQAEPDIIVHSQASNRISYLQRPDLGRKLTESCYQQLVEYRQNQDKAYDIAIVICDGLSAHAVESHAPAFIKNFKQKIQNSSVDWQLSPNVLVQQGRVAVGDDVGESLNAKAVIVLIGERPGLSSPDSLGIYITWQPKRGTTDAYRNCISNVRPAGLKYQDACEKTFYLLNEAFRIKATGVALKDRSVDQDQNSLTQTEKSFLLMNKQS